MVEFVPPRFKPHSLIRGGHLQTVFSVGQFESAPAATVARVVELSDGDSIVLHDDQPDDWQPGDPCLLLIHGLSGCHGSPYMIRLANRFCKARWRTFRMDMRGCGAAWALARQLSHAGRSDDVISALNFIAKLTSADSSSGEGTNSEHRGPMHVIGVSLGGNQLMRAVSRIGAGLDERPAWFERLTRIAAVVPPIDLLRCSENMQRVSRRLYNYYFIRQLFTRVPKLVREREDFQQFAQQTRPKTLRELDDRLTAPLSGFADASQYYRESSPCDLLKHNPVCSLLIAAKNDPIVPVDCFTRRAAELPESTQLLIADGGGHNGFIGPGKASWIDDVMQRWFL